jgi:hypothetical protein
MVALLMAMPPTLDFAKGLPYKALKGMPYKAFKGLSIRPLRAL